MDKTILKKIKQEFTEEELPFLEKIIDYSDKNNNDFFIDFDEVWKLLDLSQKVTGVRLLENNFTIDKDYKCIKNEKSKFSGRGGHNKVTIYLKLETFKQFCLICKSKNSNIFCKCFVKLETLTQTHFKYEKLEKEKEIERLKHEKGKIPVIYFYSTDIRNKNANVKIGYTTCLNTRIKPYNQTHPFGEVIYKHEVDGDNTDLRLFEKYFHKKLHNFKIKNEIFNINTDEVKMMAETDFMLYKLYKDVNNDERKEIMSDIYNFVNNCINKKEIKTDIQNTFEPYTEIEEPFEPNEDPQAKETSAKIKNFIKDHCIVRPDAEISTKKIVGHFRLVYKNKKKSITNEFTNYLKTHFLMDRLLLQDSIGVVYGFKGITLKPIVYETQPDNSIEQRFAQERCIFKPDGTASFLDLLEEYKVFKAMNFEEYNEEEDKKKLKKYFDSLSYVMYDTVNTAKGSCQGYYGVAQKMYEKREKISTTTKKVAKLDTNGNVLCVYDSVAKTAAAEDVCTARISRSIKNNVIYNTPQGLEYRYEYYQLLPKCNSPVSGGVGQNLL